VRRAGAGVVKARAGHGCRGRAHRHRRCGERHSGGRTLRVVRAGGY